MREEEDQEEVMMANKIIAGKADGDEEMDQGEAKEDAKYELEADAPPDLIRPPGMHEGGMTEEAAQCRVCVSPNTPSKREREEHEVTHLPFRSWCPHCVRGRGQASPHVHGKEKEENRLPTIALDYGFLGEEDRKSITTIAIRDSKSGALHGFQVPQKGVSDERVSKKIAGWVDGLGYKRVVIKSDQEPSIIALRAEIMRISRTEMVPEYSPVKDSKPNDAAENAVKGMAGMIRTLKGAVEAKIGEQLKEDDAMILWIIDYAGTLITRSKVDADGRSAYQRLKGKSPTNQITAIGEKVLYMPVKKGGERMNKLAPRFKYGVWLGVSGRTSESPVGSSEGII